MSPIVKHRHRWRVAGLLLLLLLIFIAPWAFERIFMPTQYPCGRFSARLEGDFCGQPLPGVFIVSVAIAELSRLPGMLVSGALWSVDGLRFIPSLLVILLLLPFFTTLALLRRSSRRRQALNLLAWGLAAAASVVVLGFRALSGSFSRLWLLWGAWLYLALALAMLALELSALRAGKRRGPVQ